MLLGASAAHGQVRRCTADEPIRLSILFDNSGSVDGRFLEVTALSAWIQSLADALRPGDEFTVYSLATRPHPVIHRVGLMPVTHNEDWNYRKKPRQIADTLRTNRVRHTDLTLSVDQLRDTLTTQRSGTRGCGDAVVLVSDGTLDPYGEDIPPGEVDPASVERRFIDHVRTMLNDGVRVYAVGLAAESAPAVDSSYQVHTRRAESSYHLRGIRTGRDLLVAAVGASHYMPWDTATVKTLVQGDSASLFPSILGFRDGTHLKRLLAQAGFGYIVFRMKSDSVDGDGSCEPAATRYSTRMDTVAATRLGAECFFHARNPSPMLLRDKLARVSGGLDVLRYGSSRLLNFDATPDSVYDPLQIIVTRYRDGDEAREPCTQATLLNALSRHGFPSPDNTNSISGTIFTGPAFSQSRHTFVRIPDTNCYTLTDALSDPLPADSTFVVTVEEREDRGHPPHRATILLHRAHSPVSGMSFRSMQPLLSVLYRRHEYSVTGFVRLADSSFAHAMHDVNVGGEQIELERASPSDCSEFPATADSASVCLRLHKGVVVEQPPNAGYVIFNSFMVGDCSEAGARCHTVRIPRSAAVLAWYWLALAFLSGCFIQVGWERYQSTRRRRVPIEWVTLLVVAAFTGLAAAWLTDEIAWKFRTEHHLSLTFVLEVARILVELGFALLSGELVRHMVKSGIELLFGTEGGHGA